MRGIRIVIVLVVGALAAAGPAAAQEGPPDRPPEAVLASAATPVEARDAVREGRAALERGDADEAVRWLLPVMRGRPGYYDPNEGAAAYWLGRAYEALGDLNNMRKAWQMGLTLLEEARRLDVRLADAYMQAGLRYAWDETATPVEIVYGRLLTYGDALRPPAEQAVLVRHAARLALILPPAVRAQTLSADLDGGRPPFLPGAGPRLLRWLRSQDPLPATEANERIVEHLHRIYEAEAAYPDPEHVTGLDDRGQVYVRFGAPYRSRSISFDDRRITTSPLVRASVGGAFRTLLPQPPENEFWTYRHVEEDHAYFLFVKDGARYRLADTRALIPASYRTAYGANRRGHRQATLALEMLRDVYRQLALEHPAFGPRYDEIEQYAETLEIEALGSGRTGLYVPPRESFVPGLVARYQMEDRTAARERDVHLPRQHTGAYDAYEVLPVAVRTARFLDADGTTRTEVYWSPVPGALRPSRARRRQLRKDGIRQFNDYLLDATLIRQSGAYQVIERQSDRVWVADRDSVQNPTLPVRTFVARGDTGVYHLALQWDEYLVAKDDAGQIELGPQVKIAMQRADSLEALTADEGRLEMSDLRPVWIDEAEGFGAETAGPEAAYPYTVVPPARPLGLYFEVYHLALDAGDHATYSVTYEVTRSEDRGGLLRLFDRPDETRTTATSRYTAPARTAREYILMDLDAWNGSGAFDVTVRVAQEATGQAVERTLTFTRAD